MTLDDTVNRMVAINSEVVDHMLALAKELRLARAQLERQRPIIAIVLEWRKASEGSQSCLDSLSAVVDLYNEGHQEQ